MSVSEHNDQSAVDQSMYLDNWVPLHMYIRNKFQEQIDRVTAIAQFRNIVINGQGLFHMHALNRKSCKHLGY